MSEIAPKMNGLTRVYIKSTELAPSNLVNSTGKVINTFVDVPVNVPYGVMNHYEPQDDELVSVNYKTPRDLRVIDIELIDVYGNEVDLDGFGVEIMLKVYF